MNPKKTIVFTEKNPSASDPQKVYETHLYSDGTTSCNCAGWTKRCSPSGARSCRHTLTMAGRAGLPQVSGSSKPSFPIYYKLKESNGFIVRLGIVKAVMITARDEVSYLTWKHNSWSTPVGYKEILEEEFMPNIPVELKLNSASQEWEIKFGGYSFVQRFSA